MLDASVDDVHGVHAGLCRIQRRRDLRQHAAGDGAVGEHFVDLARGEVGQEIALLVLHAGDVGHHDQLFGFQDFGDLAGGRGGGGGGGRAGGAGAGRRGGGGGGGGRRRLD